MTNVTELGVLKKVIILMGLPASGKTTYATGMVKGAKKAYNLPWVTHLELDDLREKDEYGDYGKSLEEVMKEQFVYDVDSLVILDGTFITNDSVIEVINLLNSMRKVISYEIHYWESDIEACIKNDKYREYSCTEEYIRGLTLEGLDLARIKEETGCSLITRENHKTYEKSDFELFIERYNIFVSDVIYLKSEEWRTGGIYGNCYGDRGEVKAEKQPKSFRKLDNLLTEIDPNISFMTYNSILDECVEIKEYTEREYYGGHTEYAYYRCDLEQLLYVLTEMELLDL